MKAGCALACLLLAAALPCLADGSAERGRDVYASECSDCHSVQPQKNKKGPTLFGIVGRRSASVPGFRYSDVMRNSGITWTPEQLRRYVAAPKQVIPHDRMKYDGLSDAGDLDDLMGYLQTLH